VGDQHKACQLAGTAATDRHVILGGLLFVRSDTGQAVLASKVCKRHRESGVTLVELLVVIVIGAIVSGMLVVTWISLSKASSKTTSSSISRDDARQAVARMGREIRDAEATGGGTTVTSESNEELIEFTTTFNIEGNSGPNPIPVLTRYEYRIDSDSGDQTLHRLRNFSGGAPPWERDDLVLRHLANWDPSTKTWRALPFRYGWMDSTRVLRFTDPPSPASIKMVRIHLLVDQDDGRAPAAMDLQTTVQLRNQPRY
jgi:prepilin-type N-terminal cleavage/methylation domain-containing protein